MKKCLFLILMITALALSAQSESDLIEQSTFDAALLESLLADAINVERNKKSLQELQSEETLDAAAFDQADYLAKHGGISHEQDQSKKRTVQERVVYYGGNFANPGENNIAIPLGVSNRIKGRAEKITVNSYADAVELTMLSWMNDPSSRINIMDPNYYRMGVSAVYREEDHNLLLIFVGAPLPYLFADGKKAGNDYGLKPYQAEACDPFLKEHSVLRELFSEALTIANNKVYFNYHDLNYLVELTEDAGAELAVDILQSGQFDCVEGNRLYPSDFHEGYLLRPVGKSQVNNVNEAKDEGAIRLEMGKVPEFLQGKSLEANLLVIHDEAVCVNVPHNNYQAANHNLLDIDWEMNFKSGEDSSAADVYLLELTTIDAERFLEKAEKTKALLNRFGFQIQSGSLNFHYAPISTQEANRAEQEQAIQTHFRSVFEADSSWKIVMDEDWEAYQAFAANRVYRLETEGMDKAGIKAYLEKEWPNDEALKTFLDEQTSIQVKLEGKPKSDFSDFSEADVELYHYAVESERNAMALQMQSHFATVLKDQSISFEALRIKEKRREKSAIDLLNNELALQATYAPLATYDGKSLRQSFLELSLSDRSNAYISFNLLWASLQEWSKHPATIKAPQNWLKQYNGLAKSGIASAKLQRLLMNYHMIMADYHYEKGNAAAREKSLNTVHKMSRQLKWEEDEARKLAQYFMFQLQISWGIEVLLPWAEKETPKSKTLQTILSIAPYNKQLVSEAKLVSLMKKTANLYPKDFCQLFDSERMGFQWLKQSDTKALYCSQCKN